MENFRGQHNVESGELLDAIPEDSVIFFEQSYEQRPDLKDCLTTVGKFLQAKTLTSKDGCAWGYSFNNELLNQEIHIIPYDPTDQNEHCEWWFTQGVVCKILKPGMLWQTGRIRLKVSVEFVPDEADSPQNGQSGEPLDTTLEEIRQMMQRQER